MSQTGGAQPWETEEKKKKNMGVVMPLDSIVMKEGELLKIGRRTGVMRSRYYILRDQALYIYNNKS
jgi:hypothetical protein